MKILIKKILIFILPLILLFASFVIMDPFRIIKDYDNYDDTFVSLNRSFVCHKIYLKNKNSHNFDSFIMGSSLSLSFKLEEWAKYIPQKAKPFHFDGSGEGIYGIYHKLKFLDKGNAPINNCLIIISKEGLSGLGVKNGHMLFNIAPPALSDESAFNFYLTFLKKSFDLKFVTAYADYLLFDTYRGYMGLYFEEKTDVRRFNPINCDYNIPSGIANNKEDSLLYYKERINNGVFYERPKTNTDKYEITDAEIEYLKGTRKIFDKHRTDYKIVVAPTYDQIPIPKEQLNLLHTILGEGNVYDFSGKNKFTEPISNYFESDHYKPYVANEIMSIIYGDTEKW